MPLRKGVHLFCEARGSRFVKKFSVVSRNLPLAARYSIFNRLSLSVFAPCSPLPDADVPRILLYTLASRNTCFSGRCASTTAEAPCLAGRLASSSRLLARFEIHRYIFNRIGTANEPN
jgi:hypothetical protein